MKKRLPRICKDINGVDYKIRRMKKTDTDICCGMCDLRNKIIYINPDDDDKPSTLKHEIDHAIFYEYGIKGTDRTHFKEVTITKLEKAHMHVYRANPKVRNYIFGDDK